MYKKIIIVLIVLLAFGICSRADSDTAQYQLEFAETGKLNEASRGAREFEENFDYNNEILKTLEGEEEDKERDIFVKIARLFFESLKSGISQMAKIILAVLVFGIVLRFIPDGKGVDAAFYATYCVVFTMGLFVFDKGAEIGAELIDELNFFIKAAVPVMCTLAVPGGKFVSSVGTAGVIAGICAVTETASKILVPFSFMMASLSAANNLSPDISLKGLEKLIKKLLMWSIGIIMTIFVSLLKIKGITGASLDNVTGKTMKFAVGNMVPVVGGIISDSLENIISYSRAIHGACGAVGILAIIYIVIPPVMKIAGLLIAFRITGIITSPVTDYRISGAIDNFADTLGIVLTITVVVSILFITAMGSLAV